MTDTTEIQYNITYNNINKKLILSYNIDYQQFKQECSKLFENDNLISSRSNVDNNIVKLRYNYIDNEKQIIYYNTDDEFKIGKLLLYSIDIISIYKSINSINLTLFVLVAYSSVLYLYYYR